MACFRIICYKHLLNFNFVNYALSYEFVLVVNTTFLNIDSFLLLVRQLNITYQHVCDFNLYIDNMHGLVKAKGPFVILYLDDINILDKLIFNNIVFIA